MNTLCSPSSINMWLAMQISTWCNTEVINVHKQFWTSSSVHTPAVQMGKSLETQSSYYNTLTNLYFRWQERIAHKEAGSWCLNKVYIRVTRLVVLMGRVAKRNDYWLSGKGWQYFRRCTVTKPLCNCGESVKRVDRWTYCECGMDTVVNVWY